MCKDKNGQTCSDGTTCASGFCVDGHCCNSACTDTCKACDVSGVEGTCTNVLLNGNDPTTCTAPTQVCNGNGACKLANGQTCGADDECASGDCNNGMNICQP